LALFAHSARLAARATLTGNSKKSRRQHPNTVAN